MQGYHPDATKTTLRKLYPALYAWLYRNDKEWLNELLPVLQRPIASNHRVEMWGQW